MKKTIGLLFTIIFLALLALPVAYAKLAPTLRKTTYYKSLQAPVIRSVKIAALRVSFQEDDDEATTGSGQFLTTAVELPCEDETFPAVDPAPHNNAYFRDHIRALSNYYRQASSGNLIIDTTNSEVFPLDDNQSYGLPNKMAYYHPFLVEDSIDVRLTELLVNAIQLADQDNAIDFSQYDIVVVFHAGVGQDFAIDLDPTPYDIPSAYLNSNDISNYFAGIGIAENGILVDNGTWTIDEGIILPESQNHLLYSNWEDIFGGATTPCDYQIGLNGTFAFMMGFYLGLPGLYNTETGESGIGKFGLMDQGSANLNGLVPSFPSAWEREFMGWDIPAIAQGFQDVCLSHAESGADTTLWRIPINDNEYFLLENRSSYVHTGVTVDSMQYKQYIDRGENDWPPLIPLIFDSIGAEISPETGVFLSSPQYDYGIPGTGLLIWHIDQSVIEAKLATNSVNNNRDHRGVDLEEGDGAQDFGYEASFIGPSVDVGWFFDPWFAGNEGFWDLNPDYPEDEEKRVGFTNDTNPSSRSQNWAYTGIVVDSIGPAGELMSFRISWEEKRYEDDDIKLGCPLNMDIFPDDGTTEFVAVSDSIYIFLPNTELLSATRLIGYRPVEVIGLSPNTFAFTNETYAYVNHDTSDRLLQVWQINNDYQLSLIDTMAYRILKSYSDLFYDSGVFLQVVQTMDQETQLMSYQYPNSYPQYMPLEDGNYEIVGQDNGIFLINCDNGTIFKIDLHSSAVQNVEQLQQAFASSVRSSVVGFIDENEIPDVIAVNQNSIELLLNPGTPSAVLESYDVHSSYGDFLALSDIDGDTRPEILLQTGYDIFAFNEALVLENNFPISVPNQFRGDMFSCQLLTNDLDGDGILDLLTMMEYSSSVIAFNYKGEIIDRYPKSMPLLLDGTASLLSFDDNLVFCGRTAEPAGHYSAIQFNNFPLSENSWYTGKGNRQHNNYYAMVPSGSGIVSEGLLNKSKTFNWPNPSKNNHTAIRYYPTADCSIAIKVYDLAGNLITTFNDSNPLINDYNEKEWNVTNIANGVYFAVVKASSGSRTESKIVKIMVIH